MNDCYHPVTLEHIRTESPAPWMLRAGVSAPQYSPHDESAFFRDGAWVVEQADTSEPVPPSITNGQARAALIINGLFDSVQPAIDAIADPVQRQLVQNDWEYRSNFERSNPTLLALAGALGLTDAQIDDLFRQAVKL